jgi:protein-tyrosine phosphatase
MKILMVCLGNICRSPIAEGLLQQKAQNAGLQWQIDSCGTETFHVGENPDKRGIEVCKERGLNITHHVARRLTMHDFEEFDIIYALATDVYREIKKISTSPTQMEKVRLLLDEVYPNQKQSVKDPWYGNKQDFVDVYEQLDWVCEAIITNQSSVTCYQ